MAKKVDKTEEINTKALSDNNKLLKALTDYNTQRHVKEENEPVLQSIINSFNMEYAKNVAGKSSVEILKIVRDEF